MLGPAAALHRNEKKKYIYPQLQGFGNSQHLCIRIYGKKDVCMFKGLCMVHMLVWYKHVIFWHLDSIKHPHSSMAANVGRNYTYHIANDSFCLTNKDGCVKGKPSNHYALWTLHRIFSHQPSMPLLGYQDCRCFKIRPRKIQNRILLENKSNLSLTLWEFGKKNRFHHFGVNCAIFISGSTGPESTSPVYTKETDGTEPQK